MATRSNRAQLQSQLRAAQRKVQAEIDRVNRANKRSVDQYNGRVRQHNEKVLQEQRRQVNAYNQQVERVNAHNRQVNERNLAALNKQLRSPASSGPRYTPQERSLADRIQDQVVRLPNRDWDAFLSYARIDGADVGTELREELARRGVEVFFDELAISPGHSQSLQMDQGLRSARCGIALLTPAYLAGRFWTQRELGALLHKDTLIPVLHNVTFAEVAEYSGILPDLAGFETSRDSIAVIADKIAAAVIPTVAQG